MIDLDECKLEMENTLDVFSNDLKNIRTGRVSPEILKNIIIDSYGSKMPLTQLSNINNLDNKMHTEIKENATNLSGGQKQCISIARALYYNPKILILDEPTNSLDKDIKLEFFDLISSLKNNITIIAITHDPKLLEICDDKINLANK